MCVRVVLHLLRDERRTRLKYLIDRSLQDTADGGGDGIVS